MDSVSMIYFKSYATPYGVVFALCDEELIGKKFKEGKRQLDLSTYSGFYKGERLSEEEVAKTIANSKIYTANVVGRRSVKLFIDAGIVKEKDVAYIDNVPFVHIYSID